MPQLPRFASQLPKFIDLASLLAQQKPLNEQQQAFAEDLKQAELVRPQDATIKEGTKKAVFVTQVPNLAYIPPGTSILEVGIAVVSGFGKHQIKFDTAYSANPYSLFTAFGFFEFKLPKGLTVDFKKFDLKLFEVSVPVGITIDWFTVRIPTLTFMTNVTKEYLELFNVAGDATVIYFSLGE